MEDLAEPPWRPSVRIRVKLESMADDMWTDWRLFRDLSGAKSGGLRPHSARRNDGGSWRRSSACGVGGIFERDSGCLRSPA